MYDGNRIDLCPSQAWELGSLVLGMLLDFELFEWYEESIVVVGMQYSCLDQQVILVDA
jgi:hypothetical protein